MITKTYQPSISDQDIQLAFSMPEEGEYTEERKAELAETRRKYRIAELRISVTMFVVGALLAVSGLFFQFIFIFLRIILTIFGSLCIIAAPIVFVRSLVRSSKHASQKDPKKVMRSFIHELLSQANPNYSRSYQLLALSTAKNTSVQMMSEAWKKVKQDILSVVQSQETAKCAKCNQEKSGLWSVKKRKLEDGYLAKNEHFLRCESCSTVYCRTCYLAMPKRRNCPNCGKNLKGQYLDIFLPNPEISWEPEIKEISATYEMDERLARLHATVKIVSKLKELVETDSTYTAKYSKLGNRGNVMCHFHNTAVKIEEKWYLLAALLNNGQAAE